MRSTAPFRPTEYEPTCPRAETMETNYASPNVANDPRAQTLLHHLNSVERAQGIVDGVLYYEYPLFNDPDGTLYRTRIMLASRSHGVQLFGVSDLTDRTCTPLEAAGSIQELEQLFSIIFGKLLKTPLLRSSPRELLVPVATFLYVPDVTRADRLPEDPGDTQLLGSLSTLDQWLTEHRLREPLTDRQWEELRAVLEGTKGLIRPRERSIPPGVSSGRAHLLRELESEIATFDADQRHAALALVTGPQRIRGLAGSGKTVVLAMKAAHLHLADPNAEILLTFYTKSLYDFIRLLITRFYRHYNDRDPDWSRLHVRHAWGGRALDGVYFNACLECGVTPLSLSDAKGRELEPFDYVCSELLASKRVRSLYDYALIDEAQDLPRSFFELCFALTRGPALDRNVVWAYDELQTIMNVAMRQPSDLFGKDDEGTPIVDLERAEQNSRFGTHDIVLRKCYRNPREILVAAHAMGFGIYSDTTVQMLENREHWEDLGYVVEEGDCQPGQRTVVLRPEENSPLSISRQQSVDELIECHVAEDFDSEVAWVVDSIRGLLSEGLRPDDIMVISLDDRNARQYFSALTAALVPQGIRVNNVLADPYTNPAFLREKHVTLSTVYRAKGNEAHVVYAIGIDVLYPSRQVLFTRNKLFTAFTRAKAWLKVSGVGKGAEALMREIASAKSQVPRLRFTYPDTSQLVVLQRNLTDRASKLQRMREQMASQFDDLGLSEEEREVLIEELLKRK